MKVLGKIGRPSSYSDELAEEICERIAFGESLLKICKDDHMPHRYTVSRWLSNPKYKTFCDNYARAHEENEEVEFEYLGELRERMLRGEIEPAAFREAHNQIRYALGVRRPKKYGEKRALEMSGEMTVNQTQLTPKQAADALLLSASEEDDGFDGESDEL